MAHVTAYTDAGEQPKINDLTWPLHIEFDGGDILFAVGGEMPEIAEWCRTFAAALVAQADKFDTAHRQMEGDLAAARRMAEGGS